MKCPNCSAEVSPDSTECPYCGSSVVDTKSSGLDCYCMDPSCGYMNPPSATTCQKCGKVLLKGEKRRQAMNIMNEFARDVFGSITSLSSITEAELKAKIAPFLERLEKLGAGYVISCYVEPLYAQFYQYKEIQKVLEKGRQEEQGRRKKK